MTNVIDHIKYISNRIGVDHLGVGADFDGLTFTVKDIEDVSQHIHVFEELIKAGFTDEDVEKILGLNFIRVFRAVEKIASS